MRFLDFFFFLFFKCEYSQSSSTLCSGFSDRQDQKSRIKSQVLGTKCVLTVKAAGLTLKLEYFKSNSFQACQADFVGAGVVIQLPGGAGAAGNTESRAPARGWSRQNSVPSSHLSSEGVLRMRLGLLGSSTAERSLQVRAGGIVDKQECLLVSTLAEPAFRYLLRPLGCSAGASRYLWASLVCAWVLQRKGKKK